MKKAYLECGMIINTHGIAGAVKLEPWCDSPEVLASLPCVYFKKGEVYSEVKILKASVFKRFVIATLEGVNDIDAASALREKVVFAAREDLPLEEGDNFIADLIGLPVIDAESGRVYGTLSGVINNGATDIYEIETPSGQRLMPAVDEFVRSIDDEKGIFITPIEGMFE
ncbi:MAG: 16S rRNA processing protein RimM [Clostridia bacterium]|nr:16S rRNA processing protein RimM [Clostridia bacterium]